eukprot:615642-Pyramimonas_sp.AAC.1
MNQFSARMIESRLLAPTPPPTVGLDHRAHGQGRLRTQRLVEKGNEVGAVEHVAAQQHGACTGSARNPRVGLHAGRTDGREST